MTLQAVNDRIRAMGIAGRAGRELPLPTHIGQPSSRAYVLRYRWRHACKPEPGIEYVARSHSARRAHDVCPLPMASPPSGRCVHKKLFVRFVVARHRLGRVDGIPAMHF
jgi:hypothetical protein